MQCGLEHSNIIGFGFNDLIESDVGLQVTIDE